MTLYSLVLFVHVTAVLALFACLSFEVLLLFRLRQASTLADIRLWMEPVPRLPLWTAGSALVVFLSGVYLAMRMSAFGQAWIDVAMAALLLIAPLGALTGKRMRAIRQACANAEAIGSELRRRLQDPLLTTSLGIRIAIFLSVVLLMAAKPELWQSVSIVGASALLGLLSTVSRRSGSLPAPSADLGD